MSRHFVAGSVFGLLAPHAFAEEPASLIGFSRLDDGGKVGVGGCAGFLSQIAEVPQLGSVKAAVIAENTKSPQHGTETAVHAEYLKVNGLVQNAHLTPGSEEPIECRLIYRQRVKIEDDAPNRVQPVRWKAQGC